MVHTTEYYSAIKRNEIAPFSGMWRDPETVRQSEGSQRKKYFLYVESWKMVQMNLFAKQNQRHKCKEQTYRYQAGRKGNELGDQDRHIPNTV